MEHTQKNQEIQTLRAIAILLVMIRHLHYALPIFVSDYPKVLQGTWAGVDLFFVISGYVITRSLMKSIDERRAGGITFGQALRSFYIRRVFRLLPVGYLVLAMYLLGCWLMSAPAAFPPLHEVVMEVPYIILYVYNIAVPYINQSYLGWHWSLSVEEQFYMFYPLLLFAIAGVKNKAAWFLSVVVVISVIVRPVYAAIIQKESLWPYYTTPTFLRCDLLLAGCAIAFLPARINFGSSWVQRLLVWVSVFMVGTVGGWINTPWLYAYPVILVFSFLLVKIAAQQQGAIPVNRFFEWCGARSYVLYLLNIPVLHFADAVYFRISGHSIKEAPISTGLICLLSALVFTFFLADVLHRWVEKPCIRIGKRFSERREVSVGLP